MDIFDVLNAISKSKDEFIRKGMEEREAMLKALHCISIEYHIPLLDVETLRDTDTEFHSEIISTK